VDDDEGAYPKVEDIWRRYDLPILKYVVELQISNNGTFLLDLLMDKVGLLDHGDYYPGLTPWMLAEILRRLAEGGFVKFDENYRPDIFDIMDDDELEELEELEDIWQKTDSDRVERETEKKLTQRRKTLVRQSKERQRRIEAAFFNGNASEGAYWSGGRFYIDGTVQVHELRATPDGLRRGGAWPDRDKVSEDLIAVLGDLAKSIERQNPGDAKKLREVANVLRGNAIELGAALLTKLVEHVAGI
jgi:hypothetical protein